MSTESSSSDFIPPEVEEIAELLPNFEILSLIAKGGMGAVYLARQKSLDREVAIKILPRHFGDDEDFRSSFETEAKSMAKLNHPNLIGIYGFGQVDGMLYIVMEMVHGKSLYYAAYGKQIDPEEAGRIICEVCHGLHNAHQHGIIHRDIKPANILLNAELSPKIGDFGIARPLGDHEADTAFGTPGYTAPEVIHNPRAVDESTDLYSVGAMLYELLTSKLPQKLYMPAANLIECDPRFDQVIRKAMNPDPALRYRTAKEMAEAIEAIIHQKEPSAVSNRLLTAPSPASEGGSKPRPASRPVVVSRPKSPVARNILIIILLLGAIYAAWGFYQKKKTEREAENAEIIQQNEQKKEEVRTMLREKRDAIQTTAKQARPGSGTPPVSAPKKPTTSAEPPPSVRSDQLDKIRTKCIELTGEIKAKYDEQFRSNLKGYERELGFYVRGLPKNKGNEIAPYVDKMLEMNTDHRISDNISTAGMPDKVARIYASRLRSQSAVEKNFLQETDKLRGHYRNNLDKIVRELQDSGLRNQIPAVEYELDATRLPGQDFVDYILGTQ